MEEMKRPAFKPEIWLRELAGGSPIAAIARHIGVPQRTLANQVKNGVLSAVVVIAAARAYGYSPIDALVANGYLTDGDVQTEVEIATADRMPIRDLLTTALRRLDTEIGALVHLLSTMAPSERVDETIYPVDFAELLALAYAGDHDLHSEWSARRSILRSQPERGAEMPHSSMRAYGYGPDVTDLGTMPYAASDRGSIDIDQDTSE